MAKQGTISKLANLGLLLLAFSRPIGLALGLVRSGYSSDPATAIIYEATAGLSAGTGQIDRNVTASFYGPVAAAFILYEVKKEALRRFPVRG